MSLESLLSVSVVVLNYCVMDGLPDFVKQPKSQCQNE